MTKREAAIVSAYTGFLIGKYCDFQDYIEEILRRPVWTQELASREMTNRLRDKSKEDFISIVITED